MTHTHRVSVFNHIFLHIEQLCLFYAVTFIAVIHH